MRATLCRVLRADYDSGLSLRAVGRKHDYASTTVARLIVEDGGKIRAPLRYDHDENFFSSIDTEEKAYWLGFIAADGCVFDHLGYVRLALKADDANHVEAFKRALRSTHPTKYSQREHGRACEVSLYSTMMVRDLTALGVGANKTSRVRIPKLHSNLIRHFVRGYFDGDGCVNFPKHSAATIRVSIVGNSDMITDIRNYLRDNGMSRMAIRPDHNSFCLSFSKRDEVKKFYDLLNGHPRLERKWAKLEERLAIPLTVPRRNRKKANEHGSTTPA